jgi:hypothetical protein
VVAAGGRDPRLSAITAMLSPVALAPVEVLVSVALLEGAALRGVRLRVRQDPRVGLPQRRRCSILSLRFLCSVRILRFLC